METVVGNRKTLPAQTLIKNPGSMVHPENIFFEKNEKS